MKYNINLKSSIKKAAEQLLNGEIIIYPTDTLYGLGVDATNCNAIDKLNKLKQRIQPYSIIVSSFDMLKFFCNLNKESEKRIRILLPGPYTILLNKKKINTLSRLVTLNLSTIGIRIPKSRFIIDVVKYLNKPIITTSVNYHNEKPLNSASSIIKKYNKLDVFYNNKTNNSKGSTIIDFTKNPHKVIREGDGIFSI